MLCDDGRPIWLGDGLLRIRLASCPTNYSMPIIPKNTVTRFVSFFLLLVLSAKIKRSVRNAGAKRRSRKRIETGVASGQEGITKRAMYNESYKEMGRVGIRKVPQSDTFV